MNGFASSVERARLIRADCQCAGQLGQTRSTEWCPSGARAPLCARKPPTRRPAFPKQTSPPQANTCGLTESRGRCADPRASNGASLSRSRSRFRVRAHSLSRFLSSSLSLSPSNYHIISAWPAPLLGRASVAASGLFRSPHRALVARISGRRSVDLRRALEGDLGEFVRTSLEASWGALVELGRPH